MLSPFCWLLLNFLPFYSMGVADGGKTRRSFYLAVFLFLFITEGVPLCLLRSFLAFLFHFQISHLLAIHSGQRSNHINTTRR